MHRNNYLPINFFISYIWRILALKSRTYSLILHHRSFNTDIKLAFYHDKFNFNDFSFLVTEDIGFIGSNIVNYLIKNGIGKVRVLDNFSTGFRSNIDVYKKNDRFT